MLLIIPPNLWYKNCKENSFLLADFELTLKNLSGAQLNFNYALQSAPVRHKQSWETDWKPEIQPSTSLNTRGTQQNYKGWSSEAPVLKPENLLRVYKTYRFCESLAVLFLMSLKKFLLRQKKKRERKKSGLLIETEQIKVEK